jgi:hypothetical protein
MKIACKEQAGAPQSKTCGVLRLAKEKARCFQRAVRISVLGPILSGLGSVTYRLRRS